MVISLNPAVVWTTCAILTLSNLGYLEGMCLELKSSIDCVSATEIVFDKPRLVNASSTSFGTVTKTQHDFFKNQEISLFDHMA